MTNRDRSARGKRQAREFTTVPVRALADPRLTALELRCLMVISLHDGMSKVRGQGGGCYARSATLADLVGTDVTNFSKAVSRLLKFNYIEREPQQSDKRRFTLRVLFGHQDIWSDDQQTEQSKVGHLTNKQVEIVGEGTNHRPELVGDELTENGGIPSFSDPKYIPLNGEIDFEESNELNSVETAHHAFGATRSNGMNGGNSPLPRNGNEAQPGKVEVGSLGPIDAASTSVESEELALLVGSAVKALGSANELARISGVQAKYISRARHVRGIPKVAAEQLRSTIANEFGPGSSCSLVKQLPAGFFDLHSTAQVPILERKLKQVDWTRMPATEREEIEGLLFSIADALPDEPTGQQAQRLYENLPC